MARPKIWRKVRRKVRPKDNGSQNVTEGITEYKGMAEETTEYEETVIDLVDDGTVHSIKVRLVHSAGQQR